MAHFPPPMQWQRQPPWPTPINVAHPYARGLMRCWSAWQGADGGAANCPQMFDAVTETWTTGVATVQTSILRGFTMHGRGPARGLSFPSSVNIAHITAGTQNPVTTQKISVMALIVPRLTSAGYIVSRWQNGATAGDQFVLLYGLTAGKAKFYVSTGSAASNSGDSTTTMAVGTPYMIGGSSTGSTQTVYVNGKAEASAGTQVMNAAPTTNYLLGQSGFNDGGFTGELYFAAVWNRVLTLQEWYALALNPWVLFAPQVRPIYFPTATVADPFPPELFIQPTDQRINTLLRM